MAPGRVPSDVPRVTMGSFKRIFIVAIRVTIRAPVKDPRGLL